MNSDVLSVRKLCVDNAEGKRELEVLLHVPQEQPDGSWTCRVEVTEAGPSQPGVSFGVDGMQAIKLAILNAEAWLRTLPEYKAGQLLYSDGETYQ